MGSFTSIFEKNGIDQLKHRLGHFYSRVSLNQGYCKGESAVAAILPSAYGVIGFFLLSPASNSHRVSCLSCMDLNHAHI